jgi:hypothetical protein
MNIHNHQLIKKRHFYIKFILKNIPHKIFNALPGKDQGRKNKYLSKSWVFGLMKANGHSRLFLQTSKTTSFRDKIIKTKKGPLCSAIFQDEEGDTIKVIKTVLDPIFYVEFEPGMGQGSSLLS